MEQVWDNPSTGVNGTDTPADGAGRRACDALELLQKQLDQLRTSCIEHVEAEQRLEQRAAAAAGRERELQAIADALDQRQREISEQLAAAETRQRDLTEKSIAAQAAEQELAERAAQLESREHELATRIATVEAREHDTAQQQQQLQQARHELDAQLHAKQQDLQERERLLHQREEQLNQRESTLESDYADRKHHLATWNTALTAREEELDRIRIKLEKLGQTLSGLATEHSERISPEDPALEDLIDSTARRAVRVEGDALQLKAQVDDLRSQLAARETHCRHLQQQLENNTQLQEQLRQIAAQRDDLRAQLDLHQERLARAGLTIEWADTQPQRKRQSR